MSGEREPHWYGPLRDTHERIAEEEAQRRAAQSAPDNSPEARLAAMEQELAEKLRSGRIKKSEMAYQLRRFENALLVEMNIEAAQQARGEDATHAQPDRSPAEPDRNLQASAARKDQAAEHIDSREMTEGRAARMARLREITERLMQEGHQTDGAGHTRDPGDRSR